MDDILKLDIVRSILPYVDAQFDSHKFICEFIYRLPTIYGNLLIKYDDVTRAHAEIANYLRNHCRELNILKTGVKESLDIYSNYTVCSTWEKLS